MRCMGQAGMCLVLILVPKISMYMTEIPVLATVQEFYGRNNIFIHGSWPFRPAAKRRIM